MNSRSGNKGLYKKAILNNLRRLSRSCIQLVKLVKRSDFESRALYSRRTLKDLLLHISLIPREQVLLIKGNIKLNTRADIVISSHEDFERILKSSIRYFSREISNIDFSKKVHSRSGQICSLDSVIEALTHFAAHRDQLYLNLLSRKIIPARVVMDNLFLTHPRMSDLNYKRIKETIS